MTAVAVRVTSWPSTRPVVGWTMRPPAWGSWSGAGVAAFDLVTVVVVVVVSAPAAGAVASMASPLSRAAADSAGRARRRERVGTGTGDMATSRTRAVWPPPRRPGRRK